MNRFSFGPRSICLGFVALALAGCVRSSRRAGAANAGTSRSILVSRAPANLVSALDLSKQTATGRWTIEENQVTVGPDNWARLCLPWQPLSDEYEIAVEFTRLQGQEGFGLLLTAESAKEKPFLFQLSAEGNQWVALDEVKDLTHIHIPLPLGENGRRYALRVRVLRAGVEAYLDDNPILRYATNYSDIQARDWGFGPCSVGLISWYNVIVFHKVEARELGIALAGKAAGSVSSLPVEERVVNGSFEQPKTPANGLLTLRPDSVQARLGWKVEAGNVEITRTGFDTGVGILSGRAAGGEQWLDLDGTRAGTVSQTLVTRPGGHYVLRFEYANNPDPDGRPPYRAHVNVRDAETGAELIDPIPLEHNTATLSDFRWTRSGSIPFTAAGGATTITFTSDNRTNSYHGIFLDNISVVPDR